MSEKKILLIVNKPEREAEVLRWLAERVLSLNPSVQVRVIDKCSSEMLADVLLWQPDLVVTYPFTGLSLASPFYILKYLLQCQVVCLRTEGVSNIRFPGQFSGHVGIGRYKSDLVDYEIFWGPLARQQVGGELAKQQKILSLDKCVALGSPYLDIYFDEARLQRYKNFLSNALSSQSAIPLEEYTQKYLILTAFHYADYEDGDFWGAGDLLDSNQNEVESAKKLAQLQVYRKLTREFRDKLIEKILVAATTYSDRLFIVKLHPCEISTCKNKAINPYKKLQKLSNIFVVFESIRIGSLIEISDAMFHYGSTATYESYLLRKPSYFIRFKQFSEFLKKSSLKIVHEPLISSEPEIDIDDFEEILSVDSHFEKSREYEKHLELLFNIERNKPYQPLDEIADFLLKQLEKPNFVPLNVRFKETQINLDKWSEPVSNFLINSIVSKYTSGDISQSIQLLKLLEKLSKLLKIDFLSILESLIDLCRHQGYPSAFLDYQRRYIKCIDCPQNGGDDCQRSVVYF